MRRNFEFENKLEQFFELNQFLDDIASNFWMKLIPIFGMKMIPILGENDSDLLKKTILISF